MLKHIVCFKLKDNSPENCEKAKEESYLVPVATGDTVTGVNLKIVRGKADKGLVDIFFRGALMEKVAIAKGRELGEDAQTTICCTRYGNVMGSRGSVIPLWVDQMEEGKPITITDPNMTRFMMTLDDAVDLVIYAFTNGHNGDLFVQKAPAATLETLAEALKQTYSKINPKYAETEVKSIGTRHGEKLYETLVTREEMVRAIDMGDYYRIPCDTRDLNYDKFFEKVDDFIGQINEKNKDN